jgi:hypothetical protein
MIDFGVEVIGPVERSPSNKYGVCHLKNADVDLGFGLGEATDEFLI